MTNVTLHSEEPDTLSAAYLPAPDAIDSFSALGSPQSRWRFVTDPTSLVPTFAGVVIAIIGFVLMIIGWSQVAGETEVWKQMPYLLSAGLPGLGLVMLGLVIINVSARRQDGAERARQMAALTESLRQLQRSLDQ
jgi:predicted cobalt transporter CbtA